MKENSRRKIQINNSFVIEGAKEANIPLEQTLASDQ
jgi:hypothetical protein